MRKPLGTQLPQVPITWMSQGQADFPKWKSFAHSLAVDPLTLHTGQFLSGDFRGEHRGCGLALFSSVSLLIGAWRKSNSFSGADECASSPKFNFFLLSFATLTVWCFRILSLINFSHNLTFPPRRWCPGVSD